MSCHVMSRHVFHAHACGKLADVYLLSYILGLPYIELLRDATLHLQHR